MAESASDIKDFAGKFAGEIHQSDRTLLQSWKSRGAWEIKYMQINDLGISLAATDLARHLACGHLIELERAATEGRATRPERRDPALDLLIRRGIER